MSDLAKKLRELDAKATPGDWKYEAGGRHSYNRIVGSDSIQTNGWPERRNGVGNARYSDRVAENLGDVDLEGPAANVELICLLRNNLTAILAALEDAEIGQQWRENSSLEKWFPFTAEELSDLRRRAEEAKKEAMRAGWLIDSANAEEIAEILLSRLQSHERRILIDYKLRKQS